MKPVQFETVFSFVKRAADYADIGDMPRDALEAGIIQQIAGTEITHSMPSERREIIRTARWLVARAKRAVQDPDDALLWDALNAWN